MPFIPGVVIPGVPGIPGRRRVMEGGRESVRSAFTKASTRDGMLSITVHDTHSGLLERKEK